MATVYVSRQCPSCTRILEIIKRLEVRARIVNIDVEQPRHNITAVPTIITKQGQSFVGTNAFMYLQEFEEQAPLDRYALISGEDLTMPFTDRETNETLHECPFATFEE